MDLIKIIITEEIKDTSNKNVIAKKGRIGYIDKDDYEQYGIDKDVKDYSYIYTKLEGNKIHRWLSNRKMKLAE